jgi:hypothetical protein
VVATSAKGATTLGLQFLVIVALLGVALGALGLMVAAGVERRWRGEENRALRMQGIKRRQVMVAAMFGYVVIVAIAAGLGAAVGAAVWWLTGQFLPLVDAAGPGLAIPSLPGAEALRQWGAGSALLLGVGLVLAMSFSRNARTREGKSS